MKSSPLFTVATITYNSGNYVRQAIESVLASSYEDFEFVISDDCSTDNTWQIIQEYKDPRIRAFRNEKNIGEYPNRDKVLNIARGEFLLIVDGDDILYKNTMRNLKEYIDFFPNVGMIWGVQPADFDFAVLPYLFEPQSLKKLLYETTIPLAIIGFAETVFHIESLKEVGGFSKKYTIGDTYLKKKLSLTCNVLFVPMGFMFWRRSPGQASARVNSNFSNFIEGFQIDCEVINDSEFDDKINLMGMIKGSFIRRLLINTLMRFKLLSFLRIFRLTRLNCKDLFWLLKRYDLKDDFRHGVLYVNEFNFRSTEKNCSK
jgi:glycosyltransferase involved in cell wall biosynthesis